MIPHDTLLANALAKNDYDDWYIALYSVALDATGNPLSAVGVANLAYRSNPKPPAFNANPQGINQYTKGQAAADLQTMHDAGLHPDISSETIGQVVKGIAAKLGKNFKGAAKEFVGPMMKGDAVKAVTDKLLGRKGAFARASIDSLDPRENDRQLRKSASEHPGISAAMPHAKQLIAEHGATANFNPAHDAKGLFASSSSVGPAEERTERYRAVKEIGKREAAEHRERLHETKEELEKAEPTAKTGEGVDVGIDITEVHEGIKTGLEHGAHAATGHGLEHAAEHATGLEHVHHEGPEDAVAILGRMALGSSLRGLEAGLKYFSATNKLGEGITKLHDKAIEWHEKMIEKLAERYGAGATAAIVGTGAVISGNMKGVLSVLTGVPGTLLKAVPAPHLFGMAATIPLAEIAHQLGYAKPGTKTDKALIAAGETLGTLVGKAASGIEKVQSKVGKVGLASARLAGKGIGKLTGNRGWSFDPNATDPIGNAYRDYVVARTLDIVTNAEAKDTKPILTQREITQAAQQYLAELAKWYGGEVLKESPNFLS